VEDGGCEVCLVSLREMNGLYFACYRRQKSRIRAVTLRAGWVATEVVLNSIVRKPKP